MVKKYTKSLSMRCANKKKWLLPLVHVGEADHRTVSLCTQEDTFK